MQKLAKNAVLTPLNEMFACHKAICVALLVSLLPGLVIGDDLTACNFILRTAAYDYYKVKDASVHDHEFESALVRFAA